MGSGIMKNFAVKESFASFQTSQGVETRASLLSFTRHLAVLEIYSTNGVIQTSEVLSEFKIIWNDRTLYLGRAVVRNLVNTGSVTVCETTLDDSWVDVDFSLSPEMLGNLRGQFAGFMQEWEKFYRVRADFKVVIGDLQMMLTDLRLWLDQVELGIRSSPSADRTELERKILDEIAEPIVESINAFIDRFETIAQELEPELQPAHRVYLRRQLHPLVLSSPFAYRAFHKPLGYAGDYEMVDMMLRSPYEGSSLFAKIINVWLLRQMPAQAHRNRVNYLTNNLAEAMARAQGQGRTARVFNLGCGPAEEVHRLLKEQPAADRVQFTLLDFNEETLVHLRATLEETKRKYHCSPSIQLVRKSVHQLLKEGGRSVERTPEKQYDLVYCAGLFDYLSDPICKRLMELLYAMVAPGGLVVATNVSNAVGTFKPFRHSMEYILDWNLVYRDGKRVAALAPDSVPADNVLVMSETTGVNLFLELRKPNHA